MTITVTLNDISSTLFGNAYKCDQCGATFLALQGAVHHQFQIANNGNVCQDAPEPIEDDEQEKAV